MREIKFRAWSPRAIATQYRTLQEFGDKGFGLPLDDSETVVMQYTGLKDKNGKEIYEGDILLEKKVGIECNCARCQEDWEDDGIPAVVEWDVNYSGGFVAKFGKNDYTNAYLFKHSEIIGNIHENPELLA